MEVATFSSLTFRSFTMPLIALATTSGCLIRPSTMAPCGKLTIPNLLKVRSPFFTSTSQSFIVREPISSPMRWTFFLTNMSFLYSGKTFSFSERLYPRANRIFRLVSSRQFLPFSILSSVTGETPAFLASSALLIKNDSRISFNVSLPI